MGTVGLSFGSPTSGDGFDVASTVSQIVSNLQNVETPWKNQLSSLEGQDTVISNLGTLFSALSTDLSKLTDFEGVLAEKMGSSSNPDVVEIASATNSAVAGTHTVAVNNLAATASGYLAQIGSADDTLSGSIGIKASNGTTYTFTMGAGSSSGNTFYTGEGNDTLADLAAAINSSGAGITASVLTDAGGSRLSLVSSTSGANGNFSIDAAANTLADVSSADGSSTPLGYTSAVTGANASLTVDGVNLTSASNTVSNLIPGVTLQLLADSPKDSLGDAEPAQIVIGNDNSDVESAINQFVTDYNSLMSAINAQEGTDSSGNAEPLYGSPTLALLQQQLLSGMNSQSPNGYLDPISAINGTTLSGGLTISLGNGTTETIKVGPGTSGDGTFYTGSGSDSDTLAGLAAAINAAGANTPVTYSSAADGSSGTMTVSDASLLTGAVPELAGEFTFQVGKGKTQTVTMDEVNAAEGGTTIADLAKYIHANSATLGVDASVDDNGTSSTLTLSSANGDPLTVTSGVAIPGSGVTASVITQNGESSLALVNLASGTNGALSVSSAIKATIPTALSYSDTQGYTDTTADNGAISSAGSNDKLIGNVTIQTGNGNATTVTMDEVEAAEGGTTLGDLAQYIHDNSSSLGVDAETANNSDGSVSLSLTSNTDGSNGALTVTASLFDTTDTTTAPVSYNASSDINALTSLGISVNNDGSLAFDAGTLDSLLNTDYKGVVGFFQNFDSWGQSFASMLSNAGASSSTGILTLAAKANSSIEGTLNDKISSEETLIATQKTRLTTELNQANQIMQALPTQLEGVNELYAAITGYNEDNS